MADGNKQAHLTPTCVSWELWSSENNGANIYVTFVYQENHFSEEIFERERNSISLCLLA